MKEANTVIGSHSVALGLRGKSALSGDDELTTTGTPQQILRSALAALSEGRVSEIVEQFADRFTFTDHALKLEFTDKMHLTEFFEQFRDLFPDATAGLDGYMYREQENCPMVAILRPKLFSAHQFGRVFHKMD